MTFRRQIQWASSELEKAATAMAMAEIHLQTALQAAECPEREGLTDMAEGAHDLVTVLRQSGAELRDLLGGQTT